MPDATPTRPPLGLPPGSVRALLALLIVAVVVYQIVHGQQLGLLWAETLMIALAHYFTSRRLIDLSPEALKRLEADGLLPRDSQPLYLPRHSVRVLLFGAFAGLAVYLYRYDRERLTDLQTLTLLLVVASYVLGLVVRSVKNWLSGGRQTAATQYWEDLKAVVVLLALGLTAAAHLLGRAELVPPQLESVTLGLVLFYFGSR